ncbi:DUF2382 domain-containing protein [Luteipulveratus sp. YIM 133132]|uniref:DUF2382 domain-containing protein n=1 Tax=Luteipulveratus flavus TaxID=3031728 RepID=UPI0023AEE837|nr:DUF2382 domain-containing protein [Luteipulveratus sp. YIM 133132]MDE9365530.1 DUF2382 domain-containing protein [Luteipulveratus sp. YIM 133132]
MITTDQVQTVRGGHALDSNGEKIGSIGEVYLDDRTGNPAWVTVNTGLFGTSESFIPLQDATVEGKDVKVPYTKDKVKDAPRVDAEQHLDVEQEKELYRYYGVSYDAQSTTGQTGRGTSSDEAQTQAIDTSGGTGRDTAAAGTAAAGTAAAGAGFAGRDRTDADRGRTDADRGRTDATTGRADTADSDLATNRASFDAGRGEQSSYGTATTGRADTDTTDRSRTGDRDAMSRTDATAGRTDTDTGTATQRSGLTGERAAQGDARDLDGDGVVTRYEERLSVAKERRETGRFRLRKSVVTEDHTVTVPLTREEVSLERFAIDTPEAVDHDPFGAEDDVREFVIYEEVPVVTKQAVAVERIGLRKNMVQEERQVTDKIRKERFDLDGDGVPDNLRSSFRGDDTRSSDTSGTDRRSTDKDTDR